jgi:hypothetical protein
VCERLGVVGSLGESVRLGAVLALAGVVLSSGGVLAAERPVIRIPRISGEISVDAVLDEPAWREAVVVEVPWEVSPGDNVPAPVRTECLLMYDGRTLYAAFRAFDPDPATIRAHLTDRDSAFEDDFVGLVLDTFDDAKRGYEFFVNPLGVQMDLSQDDVNREEDSSWDAIWASAGRLSPEGYVVELAIPFSQLRFRATDGVRRWGIDVIRIYPRDQRMTLRSQRQDRSRACYLCQVSELEGLEGITPGRDLELVPTLTGLRSREREELTDPTLTTVSNDLDAGLNARWGMTDNFTVNAALNPDFSQVEADVAQLDVNTQFALFYPEKRPFFLEGAETYNSPIDAVYTRTVVDPSWGVKLSGKHGRNALGVYATRDATTTLLLPGAEESELDGLDQGNLNGVLRWRRDVGVNSSFGALATARSGEGYHNGVIGVDGLIRLGDADWIEYQGLASSTEYPQTVIDADDQPSGSFSGSAYEVRYQHLTRDWNWSVSWEDYAREFRADSGFVPQVDYRQAAAGIERRWWGGDGDWWTRFEIGGDWNFTETQSGELLEHEWEGWVNVQGPRQSILWLQGGWRKRGFNGRRFDQVYGSIWGEVWATGDLYLDLSIDFGDQLDVDNTRNGNRLRLAPEVTWRPGRHLRIGLSQVAERLDVEGGRLYTAELTRLRAVWQFNVRTFIRAIVEHTHVDRDLGLYLTPEDFDARTRRLFTQLLFSYKLNPQTVVFVGYSDNRLGLDDITLTQTDRTFFVKLGYAWLR